MKRLLLAVTLCALFTPVSYAKDYIFVAGLEEESINPMAKPPQKEIADLILNDSSVNKEMMLDCVKDNK
jgi:hypothetical protein